MTAPTCRHRRRPAAVVRAHLNWLLAEGMTRDAVAVDTGVCQRTLYGILHGTRPYVNGGTAEVLLSLRPRIAAENGWVPAVGTIRRLRALVAFGYSVDRLSDLSGFTERDLWRLTGPSGRRQVTVKNRNVVAALYERLSTTPGPSSTARDAGRRRGWAVPAAWDDIDDPDATPNRGYTTRPDRLPEVLIGRVLRGVASFDVLTEDERAELWRRWADEHRTAGTLPTVGRFTRQFGAQRRPTARIRAAAEVGPEDLTNNHRKAA